MVSPPGVENSVVLEETKTRSGFTRVLPASEVSRSGEFVGVCNIGISRKPSLLQEGNSYQLHHTANPIRPVRTGAKRGKGKASRIIVIVVTSSTGNSL